MLDDTLLHLLQAVMVAVEHLLRMIQVEVILTVFVPWQIDNGLHILRLHGIIGRLGMNPLKTFHLLLENRRYLG